MIPIGDLIIQHFLKKNAQEKIAEKFKDNLVDLDNINEKELTKEEKQSIDDVKDKTDDKISDILKTIARFGTIGTNIAAKTFSYPLAGLGCFIGVVLGGLVMNHDINSYLDFYGKRLIWRLLVNLSFEKINNYLKNNFEQP